MAGRREFLAGMAAGALGAHGIRIPEAEAAAPPWPASASLVAGQQAVREYFPRLRDEIYLNGAGGAPLGTFARAGMERLLDMYALGPADGRGEYFGQVLDSIREQFAAMVGADADEIGWVECTKRGEQLALDSLDLHRRGKNVVTNDLHFSGSLHNLEGLRRRGMDVRVVPVDEDFTVSLDRMVDAMDADTALVTVSQVSNVNGDVAPLRELADAAHDRDALLFADIIQAAGCVPVDLRAAGVDIAACSSYKWLLGVHGAGYLYVRRELQGDAIPDRLVPGHARRNYLPWRDPDGSGEDLLISPVDDATRYKPGHMSYLGYAATHEGMTFLSALGGPGAVQEHCGGLIDGFLAELDRDRYEVLTPEPGRTPVLALRAASTDDLRDRLVQARIVISVGGDADGLLRISPGIYSNTEDMARLLEVLHG